MQPRPGVMGDFALVEPLAWPCNCTPKHFGVVGTRWRLTVFPLPGRRRHSQITLTAQLPINREPNLGPTGEPLCPAAGKRCQCLEERSSS